MATTRTEIRDIELPVEQVYRLCRSRDYLLSTTEIPGINILEEEYVEHPDASVFSSMTAERILASEKPDQAPQTDVVKQTTVVSPSDDSGFTITGQAALPLNMGHMETQFLFEPHDGGTRVTGTATADAGKRMFGKRLESKVLASFPATIDQAITRIYDVLALIDEDERDASSRSE